MSNTLWRQTRLLHHVSRQAHLKVSQWFVVEFASNSSRGLKLVVRHRGLADYLEQLHLLFLVQQSNCDRHTVLLPLRLPAHHIHRTGEPDVMASKGSRAAVGFRASWGTICNACSTRPICSRFSPGQIVRKLHCRALSSDHMLYADAGNRAD